MFTSLVLRFGPILFSGSGSAFIVLGAMDRTAEWALSGALLVVVAVVLTVKQPRVPGRSDPVRDHGEAPTPPV